MTIKKFKDIFLKYDLEYLTLVNIDLNMENFDFIFRSDIKNLYIIDVNISYSI